MPPTYTMPDIDAKPLRSVAEQKQATLTADTEVVIIHRGGPTIHDKWDSLDWVIPPGYHRMPYGIAQHFKARAIVPGSRDPHSGAATSQIGIVGIDRPSKCEPFTEEQLRKFNLPEGLDRSVYERASQRHVATVSLTDATSVALGRALSNAGVDDEHEGTGEPGADAGPDHAETPPSAPLRGRPTGRR